jgi:hypothetical protein
LAPDVSLLPPLDAILASFQPVAGRPIAGFLSPNVAGSIPIPRRKAHTTAATTTIMAANGSSAPAFAADQVAAAVTTMRTGNNAAKREAQEYLKRFQKAVRRGRGRRRG